MFSYKIKEKQSQEADGDLVSIVTLRNLRLPRYLSIFTAWRIEATDRADTS